MAGETTYQSLEGTGENLRFYDTGSGLLPECALYDQSGALLGTATNPLRVAEAGAATGGCSKAKIRNLAGTVTSVKASAGRLYGIHVVNNQAAAAWVQLFDAATGSVTLGTTTPDLEVQAAANTSVHLLLPAVGVGYGTAISIASATAEGGGTGSAAGVHVVVEYA